MLEIRSSGLDDVGVTERVVVLYPSQVELVWNWKLQSLERQLLW